MMESADDSAVRSNHQYGSGEDESGHFCSFRLPLSFEQDYLYLAGIRLIAFGKTRPAFVLRQTRPVQQGPAIMVFFAGRVPDA